MTKRFSRVRTIINRNVPCDINNDVAIGHPCGYIASASYLRAHPKDSRAVAYYLVGDASFSGDFELMLVDMALCNCEMPRSVWRHLKHWVSRGCPHWKNNSAFSAALVWWWEKHSWCFVPNRNERCQGALDAADYYRGVAFEHLVSFQKAASDNSNPVDLPF